jgi:NAD(P)-dependent dehydrogenase (short-subunit alcohol dehydrogenase family)
LLVLRHNYIIVYFFASQATAFKRQSDHGFPEAQIDIYHANMEHPSRQTSGFDFPGTDNLRNDIYPAIDVSKTDSLQQPGKVVLITGAGRGIGRSMATQYASANVATIIICARTASELDEVEARIKETNSKVTVKKETLNVTDGAAVKALAQSVEQSFGRLDILINNAGLSRPWEPVGETDPEDYWHVLEVNLHGPLLLTHAFLPLLVKTAEAQKTHVNVMNVTSIGAVMVSPGGSSYGIAKLALQRLSEFIGAEYGDKGVNIVGLHPGGVVTKLANVIKEIKDCELLNDGNDEIALTLEVLIDTPELCGGFVVWLSSAQRNWLNGRYVKSAEHSCNGS